MNVCEFDLRERIIGAAKHSLILNGDNGEKIFCSNKLFNKLMLDPQLKTTVMTLPERFTRDKEGREIYHPESKWLAAFIPTRF